MSKPLFQEREASCSLFKVLRSTAPITSSNEPAATSSHTILQHSGRKESFIMSFTNSSNKDAIIVAELGSDDVLLGRGTGPNEHQGNIRYRALVKKSLKNIDLSTVRGHEKTILATRILRVIKAVGGRFLKRLNHQSRSTETSKYIVIPDRVAVEKIKQGLRHQAKSTPCLGSLDNGGQRKRTGSAAISHFPTFLGSAFGVVVDDASQKAVAQSLLELVKHKNQNHAHFSKTLPSTTTTTSVLHHHHYDDYHHQQLASLIGSPLLPPSSVGGTTDLLGSSDRAVMDLAQTVQSLKSHRAALDIHLRRQHREAFPMFMPSEFLLHKISPAPGATQALSTARTTLSTTSRPSSKQQQPQPPSSSSFRPLSLPASLPYFATNANDKTR